MDFVFNGVAAINGFDAFGHYLRASLIVNQCSNYALAPVAGCSANFRAPTTAAAARAASSNPASASPSPAESKPAVPSPALAEPAQGLSPEDRALLDYLFGSDG
jgi:hypothetical protein